MSDGKTLAIICNAKFHDDAMAAGELTRLCIRNKQDKIVVGGNFGILHNGESPDGIVLMTCNLMPIGEDLKRLEGLVQSGTRLFALHASNNHVSFRDGPPYDLGGGLVLPGVGFSDDKSPDFNTFIGSRFHAHLPYGEMKVEPIGKSHPITAGIAEFDTVDEPYIMDVGPGCEVHLVSYFSGKAPGYELGDWPNRKAHPVMYSKRMGAGDIAYLALGHCCGPHDVAEFIDNVPPLLGSWGTPQFVQMLERGIKWLRREL